ncbi:hypothetical protein M8C21_029527 [Ambrosia artemisiifolia]|uniref:Uncharacterized protein n=1 Tax=Ambrosia artemisiifolia TaxID=4212 RepID=A0AAD5CYG4_AMBAR|nr:hypothetical protein M8C21_029527 [Ambrosia artemisiifolia]
MEEETVASSEVAVTKVIEVRGDNSSEVKSRDIGSTLTTTSKRKSKKNVESSPTLAAAPTPSSSSNTRNQAPDGSFVTSIKFIMGLALVSAIIGGDGTNMNNNRPVKGGIGKAVNSGPNDLIFIFYFDHGGQDIVYVSPRREPRRDEDGTEASLDKIKRQLASGSGGHLLQGPLLKRSETIRKWNERWVILDPTTGKMEYKYRRNDPNIKGTIWTAQLVLRAHKEAVNSLAGNSNAKLGTVSAVVTAANTTALESSKEIEAAMQISRRNALGSVMNKTPDAPLDDFTIMKETLRVKDEELQNLARDIRARESTIKEIAEKLTETAEAAESAASAVHMLDEQRRIATSEVDLCKKELEKQGVSYRMMEENTKQVTEERGESCSASDAQPLTKHVHPSEHNVDKACLSDSRNTPSVDQTGIRPVNGGEWNDIEATEARIADVREITPDTEGNSLDIPVLLQPNDTQQEQTSGSYHQP